MNVRWKLLPAHFVAINVSLNNARASLRLTSSLFIFIIRSLYVWYCHGFLNVVDASFVRTLMLAYLPPKHCISIFYFNYKYLACVFQLRPSAYWCWSVYM